MTICLITTILKFLVFAVGVSWLLLGVFIHMEKRSIASGNLLLRIRLTQMKYLFEYACSVFCDKEVCI